MKTRETLPNANKWCHIYTDVDGITTIHNTETNESYRIVPELSALGFMIEYHQDSKLKARNTISFDEMKSLALLAGSNHLLRKLIGGEIDILGSIKLAKEYNDNKRPIPPLTSIVTEGTVGDCAKCLSTTKRKYNIGPFSFGPVLGCIQPQCENYYSKSPLKTKN